jgi:hypothetical protein
LGTLLVLGHEVVALGSAEEARDHLAAERFDLALIDTPMFSRSGSPWQGRSAPNFRC